MSSVGDRFNFSVTDCLNWTPCYGALEINITLLLSSIAQHVALWARSVRK